MFFAIFHLYSKTRFMPIPSPINGAYCYYYLCICNSWQPNTNNNNNANWRTSATKKKIIIIVQLSKANWPRCVLLVSGNWRTWMKRMQNAECRHRLPILASTQINLHTIEQTHIHTYIFMYVCICMQLIYVSVFMHRWGLIAFYPSAVKLTLVYVHEQPWISMSECMWVFVRVLMNRHVVISPAHYHVCSSNGRL